MNRSATLTAALALAVAAAALAGCSSDPVAAPATSSVTSVVTKSMTATTTAVSTTVEMLTETETIAGPNVTVSKTVTEKPPVVTMMVTITSTDRVTPVQAPPPASGSGGADGPFSDGTYVIGTDIKVGNYRCTDASDNTRYIVDSQSGETLDIDFSSVAPVPAEGYTVQFKDCNSQWVRLGP